VLVWWGAGKVGGDANGDDNIDAQDIGRLRADWTW
jgi:hypothetical protein